MTNTTYLVAYEVDATGIHNKLFISRPQVNPTAKHKKGMETAIRNGKYKDWSGQKRARDVANALALGKKVVVIEFAYA